MSAALASAAARLLRRCETRSDGCLVWTGCTNNRGYGVIGYLGTRVLTHRLSYEAHVGPIPEGLTIDHLCRNKRCVNPEHLEPVTGAENSRRYAATITECKYGHKYTPENTIVKKRGAGRTPVRNCRACNDERRSARSFFAEYLDRVPTSVELDDWLAYSVLKERAS